MSTIKSPAYIALFIGLVFGLVVLCFFYKKNIKHDLPTVSVFQTETGWGYDIIIDGKTFIHQPYIPAFQGEIPFKNYNDAKKAGEIVIGKIKERKIPNITSEELRSIGILEIIH